MNTPSLQIKQQNHEYNKFDLVWAKITGYPWWPARITALPQMNSSKYRVSFLGDSSHAYLVSNKLAKYGQWRDYYSTPKKSVKNFTKAITKAQQLYQQIIDEQKQSHEQFQEVPKIKEEQIQIIDEIYRESKEEIENPSETNEKQRAYHIINQQISEYQPQSRYQVFQQPVSSVPQTKIIKKDNETIVEQLLLRYNLKNIPKYKSVPMPVKKIIDRRKKRISLLKRSKIQTKLEIHDPKFYLIKKIIKILRSKQIQQVERELPADRKLRQNYGKIKKLFYWLSSSERQTIIFQYSDWEQKQEEEKSTRYL